MDDEGIEESISVTVEDCKRWSDDLNERLDEIRAKRGEDAYKLAFMTAFLLTWFASSIEAEPGTAMTISRPADKDLN